MTKETYEMILSTRDTKRALVQDNFEPFTDLNNCFNFNFKSNVKSLHVQDDRLSEHCVSVVVAGVVLVVHGGHHVIVEHHDHPGLMSLSHQPMELSKTINGAVARPRAQPGNKNCR